MKQLLSSRVVKALLTVAPECAAISCLLGLIWWGISVTLQTQYASALESAARDTANLSRAFEENTQRVFAGADQVLLALRAAYQREGDRFDLRDWVKREHAPDWLTAQIAIIGPDGMSVASTASTQNVSVADRIHFTVQRDAAADDLFLSKPVLGRSSGRWSVQLTRKVVSPTGKFAGVVVLSIDCYQLSGFYESLSLRQGFIQLVGTDGVVRAQGPLADGAIGATVARIGPVAPAFQTNRGMLRLQSDKDTLTVSFRRLQVYPLIVLVGFADKPVLANYRRVRVAMLWSGSMATLVLILLGAVWIYQRKRSIESQAALALTLENMNQGLVMVDRNERVRVVNARALELLGLPANMLTLLRSARTEQRAAGERQLLAGLRDDPSHSTDPEDDGGAPLLERNRSLIPEGGVVHTITDVTARERADRRIRHMALHDHLTGLGNRVLFAEAIDQLLAPTSAPAAPFGIVSLDLNGFKQVNDTLGHEVGDELLIEVARRLVAAVPETELVTRFGGDEFVILSRSTAQPDACQAIASSIKEAFEAPVVIAGKHVLVGAAMGIAIFPEAGRSRAELVRHADLALYAAKAERRTVAYLFEPGMVDNVQEKLRLEQELRTAIETDQLYLEYQPQFRTTSLAVIGFEALARWKHPTRGEIKPDGFIPLAEETGLIIPLGRKILEQACRTALLWPPEIHIAVNISPVQFRDPLLIETVRNVLATTGLPASRLELEVTEGVLIADEQQALATLSTLRDIGVALALDDFGTGYASLSYLRKFPFGRIKLDRSFVQAQVVEERSRHILKAILGLSRALKLTVVAEGVETRTQLTLLREQACHAVQGFLVGKPMREPDTLDMLGLGNAEAYVVPGGALRKANRRLAL